MNEGASVRYTIISLLGLHAYESAGGSSRIDIRKGAAEAGGRLREECSLGDAGLYLWLCALVWPDRAAAVLREMDPERRWNGYTASGRREAMETAWFLTGLAFAALALEKIPPELRRLTRSVYQSLLGNYGGRGIFGHQGGTLRGRIRGRIGSFADQVYPIYALSRYGAIFREDEAVRVALEGALQICRLQGELGQWWWHYDRQTGRVLSRYPVYSVHQDGMAPMALISAGKAAGVDFGLQIRKGLEWVAGWNELGADLIDPGRGVIWRSLRRNRSSQYFETAASLLGFPHRTRPAGLSVLYECRPYHFGWLLYALAKNGLTGGNACGS